MKELMAWSFSICGARLMVHFLDGQTESREIDLTNLPLPADFVKRKDAERDPYYDWAWQLYCRRCCVLMNASGDVIAMRISNVDADVCPLAHVRGGVYRVHTDAGENLGMPANDLTPLLSPSPADRITAALAEIAAAQAEVAADTTRTAEDARRRPVSGDVREESATGRWVCTRSTEWAVEFRDAYGRLHAWPLVWWADSANATFIPAHLVITENNQ